MERSNEMKSLDTYLQNGERNLARIGKLAALRGLFGIAFAVVILIWPGIGLGTLIALFAAFALVTGASTFAGAFQLPLRRSERAWLAVEGAIAVAAGVAVVAWPGLSALALLYAIAAWAIASGGYQIAQAFAWRAGGSSVTLALGGLLSIGFGVIMFAHPGAGAIALLALVAAFALVTGVIQVAFALDVRHATAELKRGPRPRPTAKAVVHG
jgi:uncharacterized membrane protein HdeD (DUF308 family)